MSNIFILPQKQINHFLKLLLFFLVANGCLTACNSAQPTTAVPEPRQINYTRVFQDDFSSPNSGWPRETNQNFSMDYVDDGYILQIADHSQSALWSILDRQNTPNVVMEVDVTFMDGNRKNDMGVICRYQNSENYYYFSITAEGAFGIFKVLNGEETLIGMADMPQIDNLILPDSANHIRAECTDNILVLSVNDVELERVEDSDLQQGKVGLVVGTYSNPSIKVRFDNFSLAEP